MTDLDRRSLLRLMGSSALAASMPPSIARALDVPAANRHRSIRDVEHIVVLTQENRSFDHYFGTLRGVRGFADPHPVTLKSGKPVWFQPNGTGELLPFRPPVADVGNTFLPDPPHGWNDTHGAWNNGWHDRWVPNKGVVTMTYHTRKDIPYHVALAEAFTLCDAYHCSLMGPTDPNRYHLWTGWVGNDGAGGGPVITNAEAGYDWTTFPERLLRAGISWKVYQDVGLGLTADGYWGWTSDAYIGNYGDNSLLYFHQYQNAPAGSPLALAAKGGTEINAQGRDPLRLLDQFRADVQANKLPQVSYIAAPEAYSEHPNWPADYGAWYVSQVIDALTANPEVWSKTVLFINFDEEGGFFDHRVPPTPPQSPADGASTVDTVNEIFPGNADHPKAPYGLGMRVPMIVVSPWSRGGWINSQVFDHTSVIRFIEARYADEHPGIVETNITPWRRAVVGDLTSAFDFVNPNGPAPVLPSTAGYLPADKVRHPDQALSVPAAQSLPLQEVGVRPARALPYELHAHGRLDAAHGRFQVDFGNTGQATGVFHVRSRLAALAPRSYTVEPARLLTGDWALQAGAYDLEVHGPNGYFRAFRGAAAEGRAQLEVRVSYDTGRRAITLALHNRGKQALMASVRDQQAGTGSFHFIAAGDHVGVTRSLEASHGWYDLAVHANGDDGFLFAAAGHVENGQPSITDPLMGRVRLQPGR